MSSSWLVVQMPKASLTASAAIDGASQSRGRHRELSVDDVWRVCPEHRGYPGAHFCHLLREELPRRWHNSPETSLRTASCGEYGGSAMEINGQSKHVDRGWDRPVYENYGERVPCQAARSWDARPRSQEPDGTAKAGTLGQQQRKDGSVFQETDIGWQKPNPMPESVQDRPTRSHEYIFLLTKVRRYFYDHVAIWENWDHRAGVAMRHGRNFDRASAYLQRRYTIQMARNLTNGSLATAARMTGSIRSGTG